MSPLVLLDLAIIIVAAKLAGMLARRLGQPSVVGELATGLVLGPLFLTTGFGKAIAPHSVLTIMEALANVGLVLYMVSVGAHSESDEPPDVRSGSMVALSSFGLAWLGGAGVGLWLVGQQHVADSVSFVLFIATAMSVTALPVLARIIDDRKMGKARSAVLALTSSTISDCLAWVVLAVVVAGHASGGLWKTMIALPVVPLVIVFGKPLLRRVLSQVQPSTGLTVVIVGALASAMATAAMGLHYVFGAVLFGLILPAREKVELQRTIEQVRGVAVAMLVPVFFVTAAFPADLHTMASVGLAQIAVVVGVAMATKMTGAYVAARVAKLKRAESLEVAALMNAGGVTAIVVLQVGLESGVLNSATYSVLMIMTLVSTAAAGPLLSLAQWLRPRAQQWQKALAWVSQRVPSNSVGLFEHLAREKDTELTAPASWMSMRVGLVAAK